MEGGVGGKDGEEGGRRGSRRVEEGGVLAGRGRWEPAGGAHGRGTGHRRVSWRAGIGCDMSLQGARERAPAGREAAAAGASDKGGGVWRPADGQTEG